MQVAIVVAAALLLGGAGLMVPWLRRRKASAAIDGRESLDDDAIYARYYSPASLPRELVRELWHEVADTLRVAPDKLRPEDRFGKEVGAYWITSEDLDALAAKGRERAKAQGVTVDLEKLQTVDAYVRSFAK